MQAAAAAAVLVPVTPARTLASARQGILDAFGDSRVFMQDQLLQGASAVVCGQVVFSDLDQNGELGHGSAICQRGRKMSESQDRTRPDGSQVTILVGIRRLRSVPTGKSPP